METIALILFLAFLIGIFIFAYQYGKGTGELSSHLKKHDVKTWAEFGCPPSLINTGQGSFQMSQYLLSKKFLISKDENIKAIASNTRKNLVRAIVCFILLVVSGIWLSYF